jgi:hypothetical protein
MLLVCTVVWNHIFFASQFLSIYAMLDYDSCPLKEVT